MFGGMSSVKEDWKKECSTDLLDFETILANDCSFDDSNSSSSKEFRDASCNIDFDDVTGELIDEDLPNIENRLTQSSKEFEISTIEKHVEYKLSRYVRWNVLMSLGIGLWIILCIVDILHSEKFLSRDLFHEFVWGKKMVPKVEIPQKPENPVFIWYSNLWIYLWKIVTITTSGGAYALLFVLMIIFCADPRIRNSGTHESSKNEITPEISPSKIVDDSTIEKQSLVVEKKSSIRNFQESKIPNIVSIRLEFVPSLHFQSNFVMTIEKAVQADFANLGNSPLKKYLYTRERRIIKIYEDPKNHRNHSMTRFSIDRRLVNLSDRKNCATLQFSSNDEIVWSPINRMESVFKDSGSFCLIEATNRSDLNFNSNTFDLDIGQCLRRPGNVSKILFSRHDIEEKYFERQNFRNFPSDLSNRDETVKTRIITSSPAFKKFLSTFQRNTHVS